MPQLINRIITLNLINKNEDAKQNNYPLFIAKLLIACTTLLTGNPITL
jgi:hypothetical protein